MKKAAPLLAISVLIALAAGLVWLWQSDYMLKDECLDHGGRWDAESRVCQISAGSYRVERKPE